MKKTLEQLLGKSRKLLVGATAMTSLLVPLNIACEVEKDDEGNGGSGYSGGYGDYGGSSAPDCVWCGYRKEGESEMYLDNNKCGAGMMCALTTGGVMCTPDDWSDYTCNPGAGPYYPTTNNRNGEEDKPEVPSGCISNCSISDAEWCFDDTHVSTCAWGERGENQSCTQWYNFSCLDTQHCENGDCVEN